MRLLLVTPPMIQLNTPYPATAYLTGFLRLHAAELGLEVAQADASITLFLRLFSAPLITRMADELRRRAKTAGKRAAVPPAIPHFLSHAARYADTVEPAIRFLQRRDPSLAFRIVGRAFLPEGPRFAQALDDQIHAAFGALGTTELARYLASLRSMTSPTSGAWASTRVSSSRDTARSSRPARRHSTRCTAH
jgi:hypothetical protein